MGYINNMQNKSVILPNMVTLLGMLAGSYSMVASIAGHFNAAAYAIIIAAIFDGLDGKIARLVKGTSEFGVQLDSLADVVSFGVAPAVLMYKWQLYQYNRLGVMVMFLFIACGALRLARFNVQTKVISNVFFVGMPIPGAAAIICAGVLFVFHFNIQHYEIIKILSIIFVVVLAFLMVSTVPYFSFKKVGFLRRKRFNSIVFFTAIIFFIGVKPQLTIFSILFLYMLSGFFMIPFRKRLLDRLERSEGSTI